MNDNDAITLNELLDTLHKLDRNVWATLTDVTLYNYSLDEQIEIVWSAICEIRNNS